MQARRGYRRTVEQGAEVMKRQGENVARIMP